MMRFTLTVGIAITIGATASHAQSVSRELTERIVPKASVSEKSAIDRAADRAGDFGTQFYFSSVDGSQVHPFRHTALFERGATTGGYYCETGTPVSEAIGQILLPHGVSLSSFRAWVTDNQATSAVRVALQSNCLPDFAPGFPTITELAVVTTTNAFASGNFTDFDTPPADTFADNESCTYQVRINVGTAGCPGGQFALGFYKARQSWQRFIPAAPATATFPDDMPTGAQFFREVEALADTGITAGCTGTAFCPDSAVTRRQMAAFLARALGLPPRTFPDPANP